MVGDERNMNMDEIIKYVIWGVFFAAALYGLYYLFSSLGLM